MQGDTLIHAVAAKGDTHGAVLAELLTLKTTRGTPVFDVSTPNYEGDYLIQFYCKISI